MTRVAMAGVGMTDDSLPGPQPGPLGPGRPCRPETAQLLGSKNGPHLSRAVLIGHLEHCPLPDAGNATEVLVK